MEDATLLYNLDLNDSSNNILKAQDKMKVDGVDYKIRQIQWQLTV